MRAIISKISAATLAVFALAASGVNASAQTTPLIDWRDNWEYNDATTSTENLHGTGWEQLNYDTSTVPGWKTGQALFGNDGAGLYDGPGRPFAGQGINGFTTPLNRAIAAASDRVTFYFRKKFTYTGPTANIILDTSWVHDDGIVVYLNGVEILRSKMSVPAPDPVTWDTLGANHDSTTVLPTVVEGFEYTQDLPSGSLVQGENVIAVELHQSSTTSSDVSFALRMNAVVPFAPIITDTTQPTNRVVIANRLSTLSVFANGSRPLSYQWFFEPAGGGGFSAILDATNSTYTIASMSAAEDGSYYCTVSNPVGSVDSRTARVAFSTDEVKPTIVRVVGGAANNTVVIEYSEKVEEGSATDEFAFTVNGVGPLDPIVLNPGGASATLTFADTFGDNELLTLHAESTADLAGNVMDPVDVQFRSWAATTCAGLLFEVYDTSDAPGGNSVASLIAHPNFPNNPRETYKLNSFDTREVYADDTHEQYGGRIRGLFIPPYSGAWRFFINSDDSSEVWFNPNGPSPAGRTRVAVETGCCNAFTEPAAGMLRTSEPQNLVAGQAYYIEALYKEGTGGDLCRIAARADGDPTPAASLTPMPASMFGVPAAPLGVAGSFTITQQPANQNAVPNSTATFSVGTSSDALLCYQWLRGGVEIPNAINSQYSFVAAPGDNGAVFSVRISIIGGETVTSSDATLTVAADDVRPTVLSAATDAAGLNVTVTFSEPVDITSSEEEFNYTINGQNPTSATRTSPTVVTLVAAAPLQDCVLNALVITGVSDLSANAIDPNPTTVNFTKPQILVGNNATQIWQYEDTGADLTGTGWRDLGFDDSGWAFGPGPLGLEDAAQMPAGWEIRTPTPNYVGARITMYFRTKFNLATDPRAITDLRLTQVLDDGAVYWINGKELSRLRCPANPTYSTLADGSTEPHPIETTLNVPVADLVYGENVLAVEVHQSGTASSDIAFGMELAAIIPNCVPPLTITRSGSNVIVTWPDPSFSLQRGPTPDGPWTPQAGSSGLSLSATTGNLFLRLIKQ